LNSGNSLTNLVDPLLFESCKLLPTKKLFIISHQYKIVLPVIIHYQKFAKYQRIYRRNIYVGNLRSKLPTDTFPN
jgi:hypothetical protein